MKDDRLYLIHVKECIARILEFTADGKNAFYADRKTQDAVLRNLHTLAESIQRISDDLKLESRCEMAGYRHLPQRDCP